MIKKIGVSLFFLLVIFTFTQAGIIDFEQKELLSTKTIKYKIGLITKEDSIFGEDDTILSINQTITRLNTEELEDEVFFDVLIYYSEEEDKIGVLDEDGVRIYCCNANDENENACVEGGAIVNDESIKSGRVIVNHVSFAKNETSYHLNYTKDQFDVSGIYYVRYLNCRESKVGTVAIFGDISFQNPFGQLSAEFYPLLIFFFLLASAYIFLLICWAILSIIHRKKLLMVQNWISFVIFLGTVEAITWYFDLQIYNDFGHFSWTAITIGIITSTIKRTVSRLLVLVVSMGYGVVKANLGTENVQRVLTLGILYFLISGAQQIIMASLKEEETEFMSFLGTMIIFPAALLDTIFYWWIFVSLMRIIQQLSLRKQDVKLIMYKRFLTVLIVSGSITCLVIIYQTILTIFSEPDELWNVAWIFEAFWEVQYYSILFAISYLWRPTHNNNRYAYVAAEDAEIMLQSINSSDDINIGDEITLDFDLSPLEPQDMEEELSKMN